ncbi:MAG TPA: TetR/AcrR family transcriptional regulator [Jatrophihabitans sp.]|nr:TetR/AcrR family transcriptional regulator [Jatrophihabitans sp.]
MPKYVDHHARRQLVTEAAAEIVAARGVEALTVRGVAAATGFSTAVVSHYFADKRDLLRSTFRAAANRSTARFEAAAAAERRSVVSCLEALLPLDAHSRRDWRLFVAFWGTAASDGELADEQRGRVRSARVRIEKIVAEQFPIGRSEGRVRADARSLLTLVQGIATQAVFDPDDWTPRRQSEQLRVGVAALLPADAGRIAG